eukprot:COSAG02_NODE_635_length_19251_cov_32.350982_14_plen_258_part_00
MGTGGHNPSLNGQDYAVVQAAAGQMAQLDLRAQWLSMGNNVRVTVDGGEETVLQGTVLPPAEEGGGQRFRSKVGGRIQVLLVTDVPASLSFVSLAVSAICADATGCGGHGSCVGGSCACSHGWVGDRCQIPTVAAITDIATGYCVNSFAFRYENGNQSVYINSGEAATPHEDILLQPTEYIRSVTQFGEDWNCAAYLRGGFDFFTSNDRTLTVRGEKYDGSTVVKTIVASEGQQIVGLQFALDSGSLKYAILAPAPV